MKRDLQINYGILDDIIGELRTYKPALEKMDDSLDKVSTFVQTNEGKSVEAWDQNINTSKEKIANYETQINDLLSLFENYVTDTTRYISPISRNTMMRVDRNDIWANLKQIEGGITNNVFKALNKSYQQPASFFGMFDDPTDAEKEASEINRRHMERIQTSIEATRKKLERYMDELWDLYHSKVKRFENADDEYNNLAGNVKRKYTNFFEGVMDVVSSVNKAVDDFEKGIVNSIAGMVTGLLTVVKDAGVVAVSGVVPDPVEPSWLKDSADETVDAYTQAAIQFLQDPMRAVESTAQAFTDTVESEGVMYVTGATIPALIPGSLAVKGASGVAKIGAGAARRAPKLLDSKPFSGNYYREKVEAAKAGMVKVKMPVFYREKLSTGESTIPILGMERKPLGEIRPQMFSVKNLGERAQKKFEAKSTVNKDAEVSPAFRQTEFASSYEARLNQTPSPINKKVGFEGGRGESLCTLKPPPDPELKKMLDEAGINGIQYKNAIPDFSSIAKAQVEINYMLGGKSVYGGKARRANFIQSDQKLADQLNNSPELAREFGMESGRIIARDIKKYREINNLTWHELNDVKTMQLVPTKINSEFGHLGGVGEINTGAFEPGGFANKQRGEIIK
ncbi:DNase/tRNase domain of colicin-like bacteriocin [Virgibacillus chiguensis]|uniref:DNase/tRNase domain of colicin-like bacteriocin n=2 Tax=Virgibacillus chiguensis TaxID=411959 RepID=A0A1M5XNY5_9BACI|nr:DNase/tRNase domain of colicin-like bacteriocin [Virgibacillus chiguensis]